MSFSISANMRSFPLPNQLRGAADSTGAAGPIQSRNVEEEFLEIARKSPLERLRDKIMEDMKVTDESLAALDSESRQTVEDEIKRRMMEALEASTDQGKVVDKTA